MLEKILFYFLSTSIGFFIGLYWYRIAQKRRRREKDLDALNKAMNALSDLMGPVESDRSDRTSFENFDELDRLSLNIRCEENRDLANKIQDFFHENRGHEPRSWPALRSKIDSLKSEIRERIRQEGGQ